MIVKKILTLCFLIVVSTPIFSINVSDQVVTISTTPSDEAKKTYKKIEKYFDKNGNKTISKEFKEKEDGCFGSGSVVKTPEGRVLVLTNYHVVGQADQVTVEFFNREGEENSQSFEDCPVVATAINKDLALIELPEEAEELVEPLEFAEKSPVDGDEVSSAGYPGLINNVAWQFAQGTITNQKTFFKELKVPDLEYVIQHSASIDEGNSGGPLLQKGEDGVYKIVGINTWSVSNRNNTYFAIPASDALNFINEYGDKKEEEITENDKEELKSLCEEFVQLFTSNQEDSLAMRIFISDDLVSEIGFDIFLNYRDTLKKEELSEIDSSFLYRNSYNAMKEAIAVKISELCGEDGGEFISLTDSLTPGLVTAKFLVNQKEIEITWKKIKNNWVIIETSFSEKELKSDFGKKAKKETTQNDEDHSDIIFKDIMRNSLTFKVNGSLLMPDFLNKQYINDSNPLFGGSFEITNGFYFLPYLGIVNGTVFDYQRYKVDLKTVDNPNDIYEMRYVKIYETFGLRGQIPLRLAKGKFYLIPWASASIGVGFNFGTLINGINFLMSSGEDDTIYHGHIDYFLDTFVLNFPFEGGFEFTFGNLSDKLIFGLEFSYVYTTQEVDRDYFYGARLNAFDFGLTLRIPIN